MPNALSLGCEGVDLGVEDLGSGPRLEFEILGVLGLLAYLEVERKMPEFDGSHPVITKWWKDTKPNMGCNDVGSITVWPVEETRYAR